MIFIFILFFLANLLHCQEHDGTFLWRKTDMYFISEDSRLVGNKIYEKNNVHTLMQCGMKCHRNPDCQSYNYNSNLKHCELNSETDQGGPDQLQLFIGYNYVRKGSFTIDKAAFGPCFDQPCGVNGRCLERQTSKGNLTFYCLCKNEWTGKTCNEKVDTLDWSDWLDWGACSVSCGVGWQKRARNCVNQNSELKSPLDCYGRDQEERQCPGLLPCPRWSEWSEWSQCNTATTCGSGDKYRSRHCMYGGQTGVDRLCMGGTNESTPCEQPGCEAPVKLQGGSDSAEGWLIIYNDLTKSWGAVCADGWDKIDADLACRSMGYPDGVLMNFSSFSIQDSVPSTVSSTVSTPFMLSEVNCTGSEEAIQMCQHKEWEHDLQCQSNVVAMQCIVAGGWNTWSAWSGCSVTCAEGIRVRSRVCDYPRPARGGADCFGDQEQNRSCVQPPCPVNGLWKPWSDWDQCNATCGTGHQRRHRECNLPKHGGEHCGGDTAQWQECNTHHCPIDCVWEAWSTWTVCNRTCGGGWQQRNRSVDGPYYGGAQCVGDGEQFRQCNSHECSIDCVWNDWEAWQPCDLSCGGGQKVRHRSANGPLYGGQLCNGSNQDQEQCNTHNCPIDCTWGEWSEWHHCNRSCGGGIQIRNRTEIGPFYGGQGCPGSDIDSQECNAHNCPVDCLWNEWSDWGECNTTCGGGWQQHQRSKEGPHHDGKECVGDFRDWQECNTLHCPIDGYWAEWQPWSDCSLTCSEGIQTRNRTCVEPQYGGAECQGDNSQQQACFIVNCPEDGFWADWGVWSKCSQTCGRGNKYRTRFCVSPLFGGRYCVGDDRHTVTCNDHACPENGYWQTWLEWSECTLPCGGGTSSRTRQCVLPLYGGNNCTGEYEETMNCNQDECPVDGTWKNWSDWGECNVTCGGGTQARHRDCHQPLHGGKTCEGETQERQTCNDGSCPVACYWESWSDWTECNRTCGGGYQLRQRIAVGPQHGGQLCEGNNTEWRLCNPKSCAVDCVWLEWQSWGTCNVTCGGGQKVRKRSTDGPYFGGKGCKESSEDWMECNTNPCPIDCIWNSWSGWQDCNATCGGGWATRNRTKVGPYYGGSPCEATMDDWKQCNSHHCPINCVWSEWQNWKDCSLSCGGGQQKRLRSYTGPFHGGMECNGTSDDWRDCNTHKCPIDCVWNTWSDWAECNVTCGGGTQERYRETDGPYHNGKNCTGNGVDVQDCNNHPCPIDCVWNSWLNWQECNATCGGGSQVRIRTSKGPFHDGAECQGQPEESGQCNMHNCPIDCVWKEWQQWQDCSVTCSGGEKKRIRAHDGPYYSGQDCVGSAEEFVYCNDRNCPVDGYFEPWSQWTECTTTCGGGLSFRNRTCIHPLYRGRECTGEGEEQMECNTQSCPIPGDWLEWSPWSVCSVTCDGGTRVRTRECDMTSYKELTAPCLGNSTSNGECHIFACEPYAKTCSEYISRGFTDNSWVEIDPDGEYGHPKFFVFCESRGMDRGVTAIKHQYEDQITVIGYEGAGEFQAEIKYQDNKGTIISLEQLMTLVDSSQSCKQFIRWDCLSASFNPQLKLEEKQSPYKLTYWSNRWNEAMDYWGGSKPNLNSPRMTCACGVNKTCTDSSTLCNCDTHDEENWYFDEGWLTFKPDLPVTFLYGGDTGEVSTEQGKFTIGPLLCYGTADENYEY